MSTTFTWIIPELTTAKSEDGLTDVVKTVHWRYQASNETFTTEIYGTVGLSEPNPEEFTPFESLTKEKVVSWLESNLDVEEMQNSLNTQLALLADPPIVAKTPPWDN